MDRAGLTAPGRATHGGHKLAQRLGLGGFQMPQRADAGIENKLRSTEDLKPAALWIKENAVPDHVILTRSRTQATYHTERTSLNLPKIARRCWSWSQGRRS